VKTKVVIATGNLHKVEEIARIVADLDLPLQIVAPFAPLPEVVEDGGSLEANAAKKACVAAAALGCATLADDTGLEIDALGGAPGIYAARWAGPECDAKANVAKALRELAGVPEAERGARFRCVIALCPGPGEEPLLAEGRVEGRIALAPAGGEGFGYDPIFHLPERGCTMAELPESEKNRLSHRFRALAALGELMAR
jgi:XTP/dITP diphosphohydrolase